MLAAAGDATELTVRKSAARGGAGRRAMAEVTELMSERALPTGKAVRIDGEAWGRTPRALQGRGVCKETEG